MNKINDQKYYILILSIVSFLLFLIPLFFWFKNSYYVGGDDTLLYYIYPSDMIRHYIFNLATDNVLSGIGSYSAQFYQLPFFLFIWSLKHMFPYFNTQTLLYGLNLSMGFLFFYFFLGLWIKNESRIVFFTKILGGLMYVFSIFSYYTLWQSLFTPYLVSGFPILAFTFMKGVKDRNVIYIILSSLFISLFSILLLLVPWLLLGVVSASPIIIMEFLRQKKTFLLYSALFILLTFLFNFYWIYHLLSPYLPSTSYNKNDLLDITSTKFVSDAKNTITEVTRLNNLIYPFFNLFHKKIQESGKWPNFKIFHNWHEYFMLFNMFFTIIIIFAATKIRKVARENRILYLCTLIGWVIVLFMFTVNIGESFGLNIFVWLNNVIPGFSMFRNVQGKIAPAFPFIYAFLFVVSIKILIDAVKKPWLVKKIILLGAIMTLLNAMPFIFNAYFNNPLWTTKNTYTTITKFNNDFLDLNKYLNNKFSDSRIIWFPITSVNYIIIKDANLNNHFYTGLSPLQFLSNSNDLAGIMSFPTVMQNEFADSFDNKDYDKIGNIFNKLNIDYIILNNEITPEIQKSYFFSSRITDLYRKQDNAFRKALLGKKIADFNERYILFEVNQKYKSDRVFINNFKDNKMTSEFKKINNYLYEVNIKNLNANISLNFLERFNSYWILKTGKNFSKIYNTKHKLLYGYANSWMISKDDVLKALKKEDYDLNLDGSINIKFRIYFSQQEMLLPAFSVSIFSFIVIFPTLIILLLRHKGREIKTKKKS